MRFEPNKPQTTTVPRIVVDGLPPGRYRFQLVVVGSNGQSSQPVVVVVTVVTT